MDEKARMKELGKLCLDEAIKFFNSGPAVRREQMPSMKMASSLLASVTRFQATLRQMEGMKLGILRYVAKDPAEFKKYVGMAMPELKPMLELPTGSGKKAKAH